MTKDGKYTGKAEPIYLQDAIALGILTPEIDPNTGEEKYVLCGKLSAEYGLKEEGVMDAEKLESKISRINRIMERILKTASSITTETVALQKHTGVCPDLPNRKGTEADEGWFGSHEAQLYAILFELEDHHDILKQLNIIVFGSGAVEAEGSSGRA